jgi:pyrroloquinoline quinone biosynthesis protein E
MPNKEFYLSERSKRLASSTECSENYLKYLSSNRRNQSPNYLPIKLDIENLSRCNFRCVMCQVSEWPKGQRARDLEFHEFTHIIDENPGLLEIKLQGMGEPTLAKDGLFKMIRYARERHIWVRTVTNGSLLHLNDNSRKFLESDVNEIQISIDGADKETFESIRVQSKFERVIQNVTELNSLAKLIGKQVTKMWTVVQDKNVEQLKELIDLAQQMNFTSMVFSLDISDWGNEGWTEKNEMRSVGKIFDLKYANELYDYGLTKEIKVAFWNINERYDIYNPDKLCEWPFERSYIASDARVVPCCMVADPDTFEIKNPNQVKIADAESNDMSPNWSFVEIWNSKNYQDFRKMHLSRDFSKLPKICQGCYKNEGVPKK